MNIFFKKKKHVVRTSRVLNDKTSFEAREAYKAARTNLMFVLGKKNKTGNSNVCVFTSANQAEEKTTTCVNMALTVAQAGYRVLLIDADMRKPRIHKIFGIEETPGLSDKLSGMNEQSCVYEISCGNLFVLPAGTVPPNPAELLESETMDDLLRSAAKEFDFVFIDTAPIGVVTDAAVLCPKTAGTVLVTRYNSTTTDDVAEAAQQLTSVGGKILGTIMNDVDMHKMSRNGHYRRYSRYNKYGRYGKYDYGYDYGDKDSDAVDGE